MNLKKVEWGKWNFVFNRGWGWFSKAGMLWSTIGITYLVFKENPSPYFYLLGAIAVIAWIAITYFDIKVILPSEQGYGQRRNPEWVQQMQLIQDNFAEVKKELKELRGEIK